MKSHINNLSWQNIEILKFEQDVRNKAVIVSVLRSNTEKLFLNFVTTVLISHANVEHQQNRFHKIFGIS